MIFNNQVWLSIKQIWWLILQSLRKWTSLFKDPMLSSITSFCSRVSQFLVSPLELAWIWKRLFQANLTIFVCRIASSTRCSRNAWDNVKACGHMQPLLCPGEISFGTTWTSAHSPSQEQAGPDRPPLLSCDWGFICWVRVDSWPVLLLLLDTVHFQRMLLVYLLSDFFPIVRNRVLRGSCWSEKKHRPATLGKACSSVVVGKL